MFALKTKATIQPFYIAPLPLFLPLASPLPGEIFNDKGVVVASRHFSVMTEKEFLRCSKLIDKVFPDAIVPDII